ncbi:hypothetical protein ACW9IO_22145 [Pseudomonas azotoformans]
MNASHSVRLAQQRQAHDFIGTKDNDARPDFDRPVQLQDRFVHIQLNLELLLQRFDQQRFGEGVDVLQAGEGRVECGLRGEAGGVFVRRFFCCSGVARRNQSGGCAGAALSCSRRAEVVPTSQGGLELSRNVR